MSPSSDQEEGGAAHGNARERQSSSSAEAFPDEEQRRDAALAVANEELLFSLSFADYIDLQTGLVLLPRRDDEWAGAVIASFQPPVPPHRNDDDHNDNDDCGSPGEMTSLDDTGGEEIQQSPTGDGDCSAKREKEQEDEIEEDLIDDSQTATTPQVVVDVDMEGCLYGSENDGADTADQIPVEKAKEEEKGGHNLPRSVVDSDDCDLRSIDVDETNDDLRNINDGEGQQTVDNDNNNAMITKDEVYRNGGALYSSSPPSPPCDVLGGCSNWNSRH